MNSSLSGTSHLDSLAMGEGITCKPETFELCLTWFTENQLEAVPNGIPAVKKEAAYKGWGKTPTRIRLDLNAILLLSKQHQGTTNIQGIHSGKMHTLSKNCGKTVNIHKNKKPPKTQNLVKLQINVRAWNPSSYSFWNWEQFYTLKDMEYAVFFLLKMKFSPIYLKTQPTINT